MVVRFWALFCAVFDIRTDLVFAQEENPGVRAGRESDNVDTVSVQQ